MQSLICQGKRLSPCKSASLASSITSPHAKNILYRVSIHKERHPFAIKVLLEIYVLWCGEV